MQRGCNEGAVRVQGGMQRGCSGDAARMQGGRSAVTVRRDAKDAEGPRVSLLPLEQLYLLWLYVPRLFFFFLPCLY